MNFNQAPSQQNNDTKNDNELIINGQRFVKVGDLKSEPKPEENPFYGSGREGYRGMSVSYIAPNEFGLYQDEENGSLVGKLPKDHFEKVAKKLEERKAIDDLIARNEIEKREARIKREQTIESLKHGLKNVVEAHDLELENRTPNPIIYTQELLDQFKVKGKESRNSILLLNSGYTNEPLSLEESMNEPTIQQVRSNLPELFSNPETRIYGMIVMSDFAYKKKNSDVGEYVEKIEDSMEVSTAIFTDGTIFENGSSEEDVLFFVMHDGSRYAVRDCGMYKTYPCVVASMPHFKGNGKTSWGRFSLAGASFGANDSSSGQMRLNLTSEMRAPLKSDYLKHLREAEGIDGIDIDTHYDRKTKAIIYNNPSMVDNGGDYWWQEKVYPNELSDRH